MLCLRQESYIYEMLLPCLSSAAAPAPAYVGSTVRIIMNMIAYLSCATMNHGLIAHVNV
jgi:hypothetical protein